MLFNVSLPEAKCSDSCTPCNPVCLLGTQQPEHSTGVVNGQAPCFPSRVGAWLWGNTPEKHTTLGSIFQQFKIQNKTSKPTNKITVVHFRSYNIHSSQIIVKVFVRSTQLDVRVRVDFLPKQSRKHIQGSLEDRILVSVESEDVSRGSSSASTISSGKNQAASTSGRAP